MADCPNCVVLYEDKPQLIEIEDVNGEIYFRCNKCKKIFELVENEN